MTHALYALLLSAQIAPPVNTVLPAITGTAQVGLPLSVSNGTWSNSPTGFTYQWTSAGTNIGGATASSYTLQGTDNGHTVTCVVTASNAGGTTSATATGVSVTPAVFALVGSPGAVSTSTSGGATTPSFGAGESRAANNLLVCWVTGFGHSAAPATPTGWTLAQTQGIGSPVNGNAAIFYKIATGSDAGPPIAAASGTTWVARVAEFQGNVHATPLDQVGSSGATNGGSPRVATLAGADVSAAELVISVGMIEPTTSVAVTSSSALNNGATATTVSNDASATQDHYSFAYGITTGNGAADTATVTSTGTLNGVIVVAASFKLAS